MEIRILRFSRIVAVLLILAGVLYAMDEFLAPKGIATAVTGAVYVRMETGATGTVVEFANQSRIEVDHKVELPQVGTPAVIWYTPWFHGMKGAEYDVILTPGDKPSTRVLGTPDKPRVASLLFSFLPVLVSIFSLLAKRFEFAVGSLIFAIIMSAVRFWVL